MLQLDHASQAAMAFYTAGVAALGAIATQVIEGLPAGAERILDVGFAGVFIVALMYALRIERAARIKSEEKYDALEKEVREELKGDLREANLNRREIVQLMRRRESREIADTETL